MPIGFLDHLNPADRELVLRGSSRISHRAGFVAYHGRQAPSVALVVESGLVRLFVQSEDGRQASISYLHPGDIYAAGEMFPPGPAHVQALEDSLVLMLDSDNLFRRAVDKFAVAEAAIRTLGSVVRHLERIITVRSLGSIRERVAFDLLERASEMQVRQGELMCRVTHEQLADSIGSSREVVTRVIADLRRSRTLVTSPGRIRVLDAARLSLIVRGVLAEWPGVLAE
jgi:CRP-like cAMP-binding protein